MPDEPTQGPAVVTPDQIEAIVADGKAVVQVLNELASLVALARAHNVAGLLGELRAAFSALAALHPSS